jgi:uncharacterized linocin/CFP29 family protein
MDKSKNILETISRQIHEIKKKGFIPGSVLLDARSFFEVKRSSSQNYTFVPAYAKKEDNVTVQTDTVYGLPIGIVETSKSQQFIKVYSDGST